ncbi:MAG: integrase [Mycobacterium sp.]
MTSISRRIETAAIGMVAAAMLTCGAVAPANAREGVCAPNALCANTPAPDPGDQGTAEQRVIEGYVSKQAGCTPDLAANPQGVTWDPPGFTPSVGGSGNINDANPSLGGHFVADYVNGRWHIDYQYC